jgi:hypothetical protein
MDGCSIIPGRPASASSASACSQAAAQRHPIASPPPEPIGSAMSYDADVARARRLIPLVKEGFAASLTEAATRFALSHPAIGTILVGMATPQQFDDALAAVLIALGGGELHDPVLHCENGVAAGDLPLTALCFEFGVRNIDSVNLSPIHFVRVGADPRLQAELVLHRGPPN